MRPDHLHTLSANEVADFWYALGCSVKEFGSPFKGYMDVAFDELVARRGSDVANFLTLRKGQYRTDPTKRDRYPKRVGLFARRPSLYAPKCLVESGSA